MDDLKVQPALAPGLAALQVPGFPGGFPGLTGAGLSATLAANRSSGLASTPELAGPAAQLATAQAFTVVLLQLLIELLQGKNQGGPAGIPQLSGAAASGGGTPATTSGSGGNPVSSSGGGAPVGADQGQVKADAKGKVDPKALQAYLEQRIARSKLNGFKPKDGSRYGVDGSPRSWAAFMTRLVAQESGYDTKAVGDVGVFRGGSRGLFQLSYDDATSYGLNGGKPFTADQLADPAFNADVAVAIMERLVLKTGSIGEGGGQYWAPIKKGWTG